MKVKVLSLILVGSLLIITVFAVPKAPLHAQGTTAPEVTDACLERILDGSDTGEVDPSGMTDDPCLATTPCSATPEAPPEEASDAEGTTAPEVTKTPCLITPVVIPTPVDTATSHSITVINRSSEFIARYWLTWHVPQTGTLIAVGSGTILAGLSGVLIIPSGAVNIGVRVELYGRVVMDGGQPGAQWLSTDTCQFSFVDAHQDRIMSISAVSTGANMPVAPIIADYGCALESGG